jgi:hypothetical protein
MGAVVGGTHGWFIGPTGNVGIGGTVTAYTCYVNGDVYATGDLIAYSDVAGKTDIITLENALDKVDLLRGVSYTRKDSGAKKVGLVAQEVLDIVPEVVYNSDGHVGLSYQSLVAILIEAIKELRTEVDEIKQPRNWIDRLLNRK